MSKRESVAIIVAAAMMAAGLLVTDAHAQSSEQIRKDGLRACLQEAETEYRREYFSHCPGGHMFPCTLPSHLAIEARTALIENRSNCYSANASGLFTPDEPIVMPGASGR
jgi:hypothetical protein